ncbi:hypothetical protein HY612_01480 [Candidatus Roizmanbacteria bacterium]|nr:hypothetical protein [Candidatus Roizmanbacteria bacterium]
MKKIPKFKNYREEAKFWDTHDFSELWDEAKTVDIEFIDDSKKEETIAVRVNPKLKKRLEDESKIRGISLSDLARIWFIEKLRSL